MSMTTQPVTRSSNQPLGTSQNLRQRVLLHHVPLALVSAVVLLLFMRLQLFDISAYPHADIVSGTFPQQRVGATTDRWITAATADQGITAVTADRGITPAAMMDRGITAAAIPGGWITAATSDQGVMTGPRPDRGIRAGTCSLPAAFSSLPSPLATSPLGS